MTRSPNTLPPLAMGRSSTRCSPGSWNMAEKFCLFNCSPFLSYEASLKVFISHNKADKETARILAVSLVEHGVNVWFDDWKLQPGDSIVGGIEDGLRECDVFVLIWSKPAHDSQWVGTEIRAYVKRRVEEQSLRIVPIMLDATPLPLLVGDYRGFVLNDLQDLYGIAAEIVGGKDFTDVAQQLQKRLHKLAGRQLQDDDPIKVLVCPECASKNITRYQRYDGYAESIVYFALCNDCNWVLARKATKG